MLSRLLAFAIPCLVIHILIVFLKSKGLSTSSNLLSTQYCEYTRVELRKTDFRKKVEHVFRDVGPYVWPDEDVDGVNRFKYLANAPKEDLGGWYPRQLYYSKAKDATV